MNLFKPNDKTDDKYYTFITRVHLSGKNYNNKTEKYEQTKNILKKYKKSGFIKSIEKSIRQTIMDFDGFFRYKKVDDVFDVYYFDKHNLIDKNRCKKYLFSLLHVIGETTEEYKHYSVGITWKD
jgi:hypothetical protein